MSFLFVLALSSIALHFHPCFAVPPAPTPSFFQKFPTNPHGLTISHSETLQVFASVNPDKFLRKFGWSPRDVLRPLEYAPATDSSNDSSNDPSKTPPAKPARRRSPIVLGFGRFFSPPLPDQLTRQLPADNALRNQPTVYTDFSIAVPACAEAVQLPARCTRFSECPEVPDCVFTVLLRSWVNGTAFVPFARERSTVVFRLKMFSKRSKSNFMWYTTRDERL